jgi:hypothetical protein
LKKRDLIAFAATGMTCPQPKTVLAFEHRKRRVLIVVTVKWTAGARLCVLFKPKFHEQLRQRQSSLGLIDLRP